MLCSDGSARTCCGLCTQKLAAAVTYLATKLEECTEIRIRDLILVFDRVCRRKDGSAPRMLEPGTNVRLQGLQCVEHASSV